MRKFLMVAAIAATAITAVASTATASASQTAGGCVTKPEYKRAHKGMTLAQVARIFGTPGTRTAIATSGGYGSQVRNYPTCSPYSAIAISFSKNPGGLYRLDYKSAVWVA